MPVVGDLIAAARHQLARAGIEPGEAALDADLLLGSVLGWDRATLLAHGDRPVDEASGRRFGLLVARRESREPVSQILGRREFWGLDFEVTGDVLTPRPETELIIEEAIAVAGAPVRRQRMTIADVGTGTGCLAVALAREFSNARVAAIDISEPALGVARRNAASHGVGSRMAFIRASLLDGVAGRFDLIVSNPPYVSTGDLATLPPEVARHEPRVALDGGPDGLDVIRALIPQAALRLWPESFLIFEIGADQSEAVRRLFVEGGEMELLRIRQDLAGIPRTVVAVRRP